MHPERAFDLARTIHLCIAAGGLMFLALLAAAAARTMPLGGDAATGLSAPVAQAESSLSADAQQVETLGLNIQVEALVNRLAALEERIQGRDPQPSDPTLE